MNSPVDTTTSTLLAARYRLHEQLGVGRLAEVYRGIDESLQRMVLVHILRPDISSNAALRQRFVEEINASARVSHPALLEIFDRGEINERPFAITDYVNGKPLHEQGVLTPEDALLYMRQVAGAVAICQTQGLPHPPVSSSNILLLEAGHVKLVESWTLPPEQAALDLAHYRAPELTSGNPPTPASTVYALGLLFYELMTGTRPVSGTDPTHVGRAHLTMRLPALSRTNPHFYLPTLDALLMRATAREPGARFATVTAFAEALNTTWHDLSVDTQRLEPVQRMPPVPSGRNIPGLLQQRQQELHAAMAAAPVGPPVGAAPAASPRQAAPAPAPAARKAAPAPASSPPAAPVRQKRKRFHPVRAVARWVIWAVLLVAIALGSYVGVSYAVERFANIQLPQLSWPQVGLPEINLPTVGIDIPDWMGGEWISGQSETLIVNINEGLNLRDEPGLNTNVVTVIPNGTAVTRLEGPTTVDRVPWVRVRVELDGATREGWMSLNFLDPQ